MELVDKIKNGRSAGQFPQPNNERKKGIEKFPAAEKSIGLTLR